MNSNPQQESQGQSDVMLNYARVYPATTLTPSCIGIYLSLDNIGGLERGDILHVQLPFSQKKTSP